MTSLNLAVALATDGYRVVLVDADMRRGSCHHRLRLKENPGLSNVLKGTTTAAQALQETPVPGLSLISCGPPTRHPTELLGSRKMKDLLNELQEDFDFVLLDSPPVMAISDAAILAVLSDGVLLVLRGHQTSLAYAKKAADRLEVVHAPIMGVILNAVNLKDPDYL